MGFLLFPIKKKKPKGVMNFFLKKFEKKRKKAETKQKEAETVVWAEQKGRR